jgi:hypothetical protein
MSMPTREELRWKFRPVDGLETEAHRQLVIEAVLEASPEITQEIIARLEGRMNAARAALRRVLARRQLTPSRDEDARIEVCVDLAILERWHGQAVTAVTIAEALE